MFPGQTKTYLSADSVMCPQQQTLYPVEFLNKIPGSGLPSHVLNLKLNQPVILLRNIAQQDGLCNGTKLIVKGFQQYFLDVEIAIGKKAGKRFFIPNLCITLSDLDYPIDIRRIQFPIRSEFCMTINKSQVSKSKLYKTRKHFKNFDFNFQGATLKKVAVYLNDHCFSHGQLYVALSRVASFKDIIIATNSVINGTTRNFQLI